MTGPDPDGSPATVDREWFRFGVAIAVLHLLFLALVGWLLRIDVVLAVIVAAALSTVGGIAITAYVLWVK